MKVACLQLEFTSFFPPRGLGSLLDSGRVGVQLVGPGLESAGNSFDLVAQPNQMGVLVPQPEAAGVGGGRKPHRGFMTGHRPVERLV